MKITSCNCKFKKTFIMGENNKFIPCKLAKQYTLDGVCNRIYSEIKVCPVCGKKIEVEE